MAKTKEPEAEQAESKAEQTEQAAEPVEEKAEAVPEQAAPTAVPAPEQKKVRKDSGALRVILTVLLILVGVGELGLWGFYGFGVFQNVRAMRQSEEERQTSTAGGSVAGSSFGPSQRVENGVVTWQREEDVRTGGTLSAGGTGLSQSGGDKRLSRLTVPEIPYELADMETESTPAAPEAEPSDTLTDA